MTLNILKCNHLTSLHFKGFKQAQLAFSAYYKIGYSYTHLLTYLAYIFQWIFSSV